MGDTSAATGSRETRDTPETEARRTTQHPYSAAAAVHSGSTLRISGRRSQSVFVWYNNFQFSHRPWKHALCLTPMEGLPLRGLSLDDGADGPTPALAAGDARSEEGESICRS